MMLRLQEIGKSFNSIPALVNVTIELKPGEAHALLGENGAGKSTLIKIMSGLHQPSSGIMTFDDRPVVFDTPTDAVRCGISIVPQERNIVPEQSIAENVFMGRLPRRAGFVNYRRLNADAQQWLSMVGLHLDVRQDASVLSPGQGQLLEIARALSLESRILLLDEPTASIGEEEVNRLFELLSTLKAQGRALLFVSHKLDEVYRICDRITVIRDGHTVIEGGELSTVDRPTLIKAMVGRQFVESPFAERPAPGAVTLELRDVSTRCGHEAVNLSLREGEIVGLYGLVGAGRTELARSIVGLDRITGGTVLVNGYVARIPDPAVALQKYHLGYVSEDRKGEGLIVSDTIGRNASMTIWAGLAKPFGFLSRTRTWPAVLPSVERLKVRMTSPDQVISELSGGNQQKISVAKWLAAEADILLCDEPTVGIDIGAKDQMHRLIWDLAASGKTVLIISSDLREVVQLADRVLVMANNRICADLPNNGQYEGMSRQIMRVIVRS
ncbi:MAG: hypothetical protein B5766_09370 [Candidatus Lumbricidophila eiseniae]|uniref:ABC transporter domain-containing protein n=1 Tax=Candidatus Lumbricidiphila eiseniae TaxID=1969409 RepID=A0A2A6FPX2_9MICO|nr:MAG: hypothetical protein B5766_09370 [Candidatus Lumbricidophila eiseniae]